MSFKSHTNNPCSSNLSSGSKNVKSCKRAGPRKVLLSNNIAPYPDNAKSCSTGAIMEKCNYNHRHFTKSDFTFAKKNTRKECIDFCKKCGDQKPSTSDSSNSDKAHNVKSVQKINSDRRNVRKNDKPKINAKNVKSNGVKQYYRNENFKSTDSIQETEMDFRKISLDTIKEVTDTDSVVEIYDVYTDSGEEIGFMDTEDPQKLDQIKKFRTENFFECHSVKSRVDHKGSVTSLIDHKCAYRFYLNDRLFPVPLNSDYKGTVRCIECHLPIDLKYDSFSNIPNGTIQAKVKMDDEAQDMILILPVKESLVIKQRRRQIKEENEVLYFGVIKLDNYGNSIFNSTLPSDSLALKYQKGYKEFERNDDYKYKGVKKDDVIII